MILGLLLGMAIGFGLGWVSKPKYSPNMSRGRQVAIVAVSAGVAAGALGYAVGERGWPLVTLCLLLPLVFVAPYAGGLIRERADR